MRPFLLSRSILVIGSSDSISAATFLSVCLALIQEAISRKRRRIQDGMAVTPLGGDEGEEGGAATEDEGPVVNLDDYKGPLNKWIALESTRGEIKRRFRQFLLEFKGSSSTRSHCLPLCSRSASR